MPRGSNVPLEVYLNLLFSWDDEHQNLWKCVTWTFVTPEGETKFANYAAQGYDKLIDLVESRTARAGANVYIAMGTQRLVNVDKYSVDGYPAAVRKVNNVVSFKSIHLDIDVGKGGAYATTDDAYAALDDFLDNYQLPSPTMEVKSGSGGLHIYWCTKDPMPIAAWLPLARGLRDAALKYGLKFDPQVSVNPTGILRPPGTLNYKKQPPAPVILMEDTGFPIYGYQQLVNAFGHFVGPMPGVRNNQGNVNNVSAMQRPQGAGGAGVNQNFSAGMGGSTVPVSVEDVARVCPVVDDSLARGGKGDSEPLWNQLLLLASFTEDPTDAAHKLSQGDGRYTKAETDRKLGEKVQARATSTTLGWPACSAFSPLSTLCQQCPLFAQGKSPLSFATRVKSTPPPSPGQNADTLMPDGYWRQGGIVQTTETDKDGNAQTVWPLGGYPVLDAGIDPMTNQLVIRTEIGKVEKWGALSVSGNLGPLQAAQALAGVGIYLGARWHRAARDFLVAWMTHLQTIKRHIQPATYGWTDDGKGFTFGDKTYFTDGTDDVAFRGNTLDKRFTAKGELKPWQDSLRLVAGNAALETIVASSFAAPLIGLMSADSVVMSVYSAASGVGKTTALSIAQAVWGHPREGMSALDDTENSVMKKVADLKNLPIYYDELISKDRTERALKLVFKITGSKAKSRLTRDITQADTPAFSTLFCVASNHGIGSTVFSDSAGTEAGGLRVFEMEVPLLVPTVGGFESRQLWGEPLFQNHGIAGRIYANFIAANKDVIKQMVVALGEQLNQRYQFTSKERYWSTTMVALQLAALLANQCGLTTFNIGAIEAYLDNQFQRQRAGLKGQSFRTMSSDESILDLMNELQSELFANGNLVMTEYIRTQTGRPGPQVMAKDFRIDRLGDVWMQVGEKDHRVRVRARAFQDWMSKHGLVEGPLLTMLKKYYHVQTGRLVIGAGVPGLPAAGRVWCYDMAPLPTHPSANPDSA